MKKRFAYMITILFCGMITSSLSLNTATPHPPTKAVNDFIQKMVKQYQIKPAYLRKILSKAQYEPKVIAKITHPFEKKPWNYYRRYFITPTRIEGGVQYWNTHAKTLRQVTKKYGVPSSIIIAIIGIESKFGAHTGRYNELNALYTLSFYYPPRARFFKKELAHYILLSKKHKLDTINVLGSYAGALGIPQFMPSSYRHYGIDFSHNNQPIDLINNHQDAIASVGNYLKKAGWKAHQPVAVRAKYTGIIPNRLISARAKPRYTLTQLEKHHIYPTIRENKQQKVALIEMQNTQSKEYWIVFKNFKAIMAYNPSTTYSLAVYELSQAIKSAHERQNIEANTSAAPGRSLR